MEDGCEELVSLSYGGELRLAHNGELFHEAEPEAVGGRVVVGVVGQCKILLTTDFFSIYRMDCLLIEQIKYESNKLTHWL